MFWQIWKKDRGQGKVLKMKDLISKGYQIASLQQEVVFSEEVSNLKFLSNLLPFCFLGSKVRISKGSRTENASEHSEVTICCSLEGAISPASLFSVMWYRQRGDSGSRMLVHLQHDGLLEYGEEGLRWRLHSYRSSAADFVLALQRVEMKDAGKYWCKVEEWQLHSNPSKWVSQASDESQPVVLRVLPSGNQRFIGHGLQSGESLSLLLCFPALLCFASSQAEHNLQKENDFSISLNSNSFRQTRLHEVLAWTFKCQGHLTSSPTSPHKQKSHQYCIPLSNQIMFEADSFIS